MLANIIDRRYREYAAARINAVIEQAWHDNHMAEADQHSEDGDELEAEVRHDLSLAEAIAWANSFQTPVTLHLYDIDNDPMAVAPLPAAAALPAFRRASDLIQQAVESLTTVEAPRLKHLLKQAQSLAGWSATVASESEAPRR